MTRDPRFDVLFEPVRIGPVTSPNRFYQVPHCTGMGYARPRGLAAMREVKAEGGWGVVCTEYCSVHPSSEDEPMQTAALWDDADIRAQALMVEGVHRHGSLAGVELWHGGSADHNGVTREETLGVRSMPTAALDPVQSRRMDKRDIRDVRRWHVEAARRAVTAGFDIVYVYATHGYLLSQFLSPLNQRSDEYGGSLENRVRIVRELIEETREAVGDSAAVAVRFSANSGGPDGKPESEEPREMFALLEGLPDLWDINIADYSYEQGVSRFVAEAAFEDYVSWVKRVTDKPVVSVGRFTSPETILRQVTSGFMDLIGAARPSIADPFLPTKIREGRFDDIRECIGCNICAGWHRRGAPLRCTQNPSMGDEWRGWHPERIEAKASDRGVLVVGAGPAGLEAARALGQRGYAVTLTEASRELGGRVRTESGLPGLAEWMRVRDWRIGQLNKLPNVEIFRESRLDAEQIMEFGADRVALATGASWRASGVGRASETPIEGWQADNVLTPDDVMAERELVGPVLVYDDDHYYMGSVIAEQLALRGLEVSIVTPSGVISEWGYNTEEQFRTQRRLLELGVRIETSTLLSRVASDHALLSCLYTQRTRESAFGSVVMVTSREPLDDLYFQLCDRIDIARVGDCSAPGTIAAAVHAGHRYAREMDTVPDRDSPLRLERPTPL